MKFIAGLVVVALIGYGALHYGGMLSFDPAQQGKDARAAIKPGMTWNKVVSAASKPSKCRFYVVHKKTVAGQQIEFSKPGPFMKFDEKNLADRLHNDSLPEGFEFLYKFTVDDAFLVKFDAAGDVVSVQNAPTMKDFLDL